MTNKHIELPALSDEQINEDWKSAVDSANPTAGNAHFRFARTIEKRFVAAQQRVLAEESRVVGEPVAWRWKERDRFFDWTTDWTHYEKAKAMGCEIEYAHTLASPPAPQEAQADTLETLRRARQYVLHASTSYYDGTDGASIRQSARNVLKRIDEALAAPVAQPVTEQEEAPSDADPLTPEQEEWVMDLAERHNLGRRVPQIGAMRGVAPDVFYTDASYRTHELFCFAAELLSTKEQS